MTPKKNEKKNQTDQHKTPQKNSAKAQNTPETPDFDPNTEPRPIQINGFQQVLDMLKIADPAFRESLLKRLAARDKELAKSLRRDLNNP